VASPEPWRYWQPYVGALCKHDLVRGETGIVLLIAPDQRQAKIALDYCAAALEQSPILKQLIANRSADTLELTNGISIEVRSASFRRLRGPTYVAVIADEAAFWYSDEFSANTDAEILNAVRPGLATSQGPLIIASSPYAKRGVLWETHRSHYGPEGDPLILVAQGASRDFNPTLQQSVVHRALERDSAAASAEYLAQFRSDIEGFVSNEVVRACVGGHFEMAPLEQHRYHAFVDPSGGSADSFTMAISHKEGDRVVIDAVHEVRPPFSPETVVDDFAIILKSTASVASSETGTPASGRESNFESGASATFAVKKSRATSTGTCSPRSIPAASCCRSPSAW
jgi:hypothetical protein